jgi:hypothetical protein
MTAMTSGMMSSKSAEWETPQWLFNLLDEEFHFGLDVCATHENHKCARYFTKEDDGLSQAWEGTVWENPPYGREIGPWVKRAMEHGRGGSGSLPGACTHGYPLVDGLLHESQRDKAHRRQIEIREFLRRCAIPICRRHLRYRPYANIYKN